MPRCFAGPHRQPRSAPDRPSPRSAGPAPASSPTPPGHRSDRAGSPARPRPNIPPRQLQHAVVWQRPDRIVERPRQPRGHRFRLGLRGQPAVGLRLRVRPHHPRVDYPLVCRAPHRRRFVRRHPGELQCRLHHHGAALRFIHADTDPSSNSFGTSDTAIPG